MFLETGETLDSGSVKSKDRLYQKNQDDVLGGIDAWHLMARFAKCRVGWSTLCDLSHNILSA